MQMLSLVWGMLSMVGLGIAFLPCLGSLNWLNIPFAIVGLIISIVAASNAPMGQRGTAACGVSASGKSPRRFQNQCAWA